jgi:hypothetical protein
MAEIRKQEPSNPDNWLHDGALDWQRLFRKLVYLGKEAEPWLECTEAEMLQWKSEHKEDYPEDFPEDMPEE